MDHFCSILGPFRTILLTALSTVCHWSCGFVDHFLEVKWLEQVNFHFGFIFLKTHCWSKGTRYRGGGGLFGVRSTIRSDPWGGGRFGEGPIHDPDQKVPRSK